LDLTNIVSSPGNLGGEHITDTTRGPYNEGGLYGERNGWHLPGYPDNGWKSVSLPETTARSGVSWYRTTFNLKIPKNHDVPLGIQFNNGTSERYRALLFINGWQFGKYGKSKCLCNDKLADSRSSHPVEL
jgi:beta-galactosidase GanA